MSINDQNLPGNSSEINWQNDDRIILNDQAATHDVTCDATNLRLVRGSS
jgi:hypothetical protein